MNADKIEVDLHEFTDTITKMNAVTFARDGQYCVVACEDKKIYVLDVNEWKPVTSMTGHRLGVNSVIVSPDGVNVISSDVIGKVFAWKLTSGKKVGGFEGVRGRVESLAFSPDGKLVMAADTLRNVHLWIAANGQPALSPISQRWPVKSVTFSPDSTLAAAACGDGTISILDLTDGSEKLSIKPPTGESLATRALNSVAFSADGKSLITAGADNMLRLWEAETGDLLAQFEGHTGPVNQVVVSADGKYALSGSDDKTMRLWEMPEAAKPAAPDPQNRTLQPERKPGRDNEIRTGKESRFATSRGQQVLRGVIGPGVNPCRAQRTGAVLLSAVSQLPQMSGG